MSDLTVPGVYLLTSRASDAKSPVVYFDGKLWWYPGWECGMKLNDYSSETNIDRSTIGALIWEDWDRE